MEQKLIATIRNKIINSPANSAWDRGVRTYALEIFDNYIEEHNSNKQITEKAQRIKNQEKPPAGFTYQQQHQPKRL